MGKNMDIIKYAGEKETWNFVYFYVGVALVEKKVSINEPHLLFFSSFITHWFLKKGVLWYRKSEVNYMITQSVNINSLSKIQSLVNILNSYQGRFELISGATYVNAKSIMGIFSLDISKPLILNIYNEECADSVIQEIADYVR